MFSLAIVLMVASAAPVQTGQATPQPVASPAAKPAKVRKICRQDRTTGSRLSGSTCLTAEQWAERDAAAKDGLEDLRRQSGSQNSVLN